MAKDAKKAARRDGEIVTDPRPEPHDTWARNPAGEPGRGTTTAPETGRPRDKEVARGGQDVVPGFTTTGVTGSQSGRVVHGTTPEGEPRRKPAHEEDEEG